MCQKFVKKFVDFNFCLSHCKPKILLLLLFVICLSCFFQFGVTDDSGYCSLWILANAANPKPFLVSLPDDLCVIGTSRAYGLTALQSFTPVSYFIRYSHKGFSEFLELENSMSRKYTFSREGLESQLYPLCSRLEQTPAHWVLTTMKLSEV